MQVVISCPDNTTEFVKPGPDATNNLDNDMKELLIRITDDDGALAFKVIECDFRVHEVCGLLDTLQHRILTKQHERVTDQSEAQDAAPFTTEEG